MMKPVIRDYQFRDYDMCRALWKELTERHREIYNDPSIGGDDPGQGFEAYLANPKRRASWVVEIQGQIVALAGLVVNGDEGEIEPVIVSSRYRSRGIGTMLVRHVVEEARCMHVGYVSVRPVARNKEAISFFVRLGFDLLGQVELFRDFSGAPRSKWESGISVHGHKLGY
jgi:GNAT superfamily N-acetyltransferase